MAVMAVMAAMDHLDQGVAMDYLVLQGETGYLDLQVEMA